ncbi:MAG: Dihydroorotate dehydrogenase (quinone), mitochondrial [Cirrosporium novae-zelandiae]|nr:MAG: Dihydroorotate dehydrogenase (quinone), mitochondrial [Cirrosporium novae-zelandiae]
MVMPQQIMMKVPRLAFSPAFLLRSRIGRTLPSTRSYSFHANPQSFSKGPASKTWRRNASTSTDATSTSKPSPSSVRNIIYGTSLTLALVFGYYYITDARASVHRWLFTPLMRVLIRDGEAAHKATIESFKLLWTSGLYPRERGNPDGDGELEVKVLGHTLSNPLSTAAGLDKNAEAIDPMFALGPSIVEIGAITPRPQDGNPKPRVFRVPSQQAIINRFGLPNQGADRIAIRLQERVRKFAYKLGLGLGPEGEQKVLDGEANVPPGSLANGKLLALQIAKQKTTPDDNVEAVRDDYVYCVKQIGKYADIVTVNVSSPNMPGLRNLQRVEPLKKILSGVVEAVQKLPTKRKPTVLVKVSPDEDSDEQISGICEAIYASGVDGVIVANSTRGRPDPVPTGYQLSAKEARTMLEPGGFSGPQLYPKTLSLVGRYRKALDQQAAARSITPRIIFASGGITNGKEAKEVLDAGATVAMVYTAMVYQGPGTFSKMKKELKELKKKDGKP